MHADLSKAFGQLDISEHASAPLADAAQPPRSPRPAKPLSARSGRRKLLVLDANGFLFWRARRGGSNEPRPERPPDANSGNFSIWRRPRVREFIVWAAERFHLVVWSTAMRHNIAPMVELAFEGLPPPLAIFDQSDCTDSGCVDPQNRHKRLMLKRLDHLWASDRVLSAAGSFGPSDTLLIDDSPYKAAENPEHTAVHPTEWSALDADDSPNTLALTPDGEVCRLLALVAEADDVRHVVRQLYGEQNGRAPPGFWQKPEESELLRMVRRARTKRSETLAAVSYS